ncbi:hypothetical protein VNO80_15856 [Phaseolus coccineus]|uniref:Uncharacterized protein n=1 Tax=Phaseolus coccineus TaxID=3886 RepID=A0AAN9ML07_PHACN
MNRVLVVKLQCHLTRLQTAVSAPGTFFEVQTDVCECFCAIHWDPSHADCAVPQLETDQVLQQLKYAEVVLRVAETVQ